MNTFPLNFVPEGAGDGRFCRSASGEWIPDGGAWQSQGYDENGLLRSLNGTLTGVHTVLSSASEKACRGRQGFCLGHDSGYIIPIYSKIGQEMRNHFKKLVNGYGKSAVGKRKWQSSALVSPTKTLNRDLAPIGDDIEPVGESRADVEMGNEEDAEPVEAEIPRVRMNPKNPTRREKQEHEDSGHALHRSWCAACGEGRDVGGQRRIEPFEEEERTTLIVAFDYGFLTQEKAGTFPILICRDSRYGQTGATCCERKSPTAHSISLLVGVHQRSWFSQNHFEMR